MPGTTAFEWLEGRNFIVQRSHSDRDLFPDAICIIGAPEDGDGLVMEVTYRRRDWFLSGAGGSARPAGRRSR